MQKMGHLHLGDGTPRSSKQVVLAAGGRGLGSRSAAVASHPFACALSLASCPKSGSGGGEALPQP